MRAYRFIWIGLLFLGMTTAGEAEANRNQLWTYRRKVTVERIHPSSPNEGIQVGESKEVKFGCFDGPVSCGDDDRFLKTENNEFYRVKIECKAVQVQTYSRKWFQSGEDRCSDRSKELSEAYSQKYKRGHCTLAGSDQCIKVSRDRAQAFCALETFTEELSNGEECLDLTGSYYQLAGDLDQLNQASATCGDVLRGISALLGNARSINELKFIGHAILSSGR